MSDLPFLFPYQEDLIQEIFFPDQADLIKVDLNQYLVPITQPIYTKKKPLRTKKQIHKRKLQRAARKVTRRHGK